MMETYVENPSLMMRNVRKRFFNNTLTDEDLKNFVVINKKYIIYSKDKCIELFIENYGYVYMSGEAAGHLTRKSLEIFKRKPHNKLCDLLVVKKNSNLWNELFLRGFYSFNPHRIIPESVVAFKRNQNK